ncbi:MAG: alpha/beta hydrolase family protein [Gammaproteobacteria bacterium]
MAFGSSASEWRVEVGAEETTAVFEPAIAPAKGSLFVCAHGAGGHMADRGMLALAERLRSCGIHIVRFNFLYREKRAGRPDTMPGLKECISAVASRARHEVGPELLIIGGRSLGGRAASMLAAEGYPCDALLLLAYPLHPPGKPDKLRDAHLAQIKVPVLCLNGTRDNFCRRDLMESVISGLTGWTMHWLQAADHGFHVPKRSGRSDSDVLNEIGDVTGAWESRLVRRNG